MATRVLKFVSSRSSDGCGGKEEAAEAAGASAETSWPSRADGAVKLAESFLAGNPVRGTGGERFQVMVHLEQEVLGPDGAWAGTLEDGTHVSAEALRRVACDCGLVATGGDGEALNIGRRALMLRERGCALPGCTHTAFLHGHHIEHWLREWADERDLDLGPDINMPQWDGKSPNYADAVEWLLAAGQ